MTKPYTLMLGCELLFWEPLCAARPAGSPASSKAARRCVFKATLLRRASSASGGGRTHNHRDGRRGRVSVLSSWRCRGDRSNDGSAHALELPDQGLRAKV